MGASMQGTQQLSTQEDRPGPGLGEILAMILQKQQQDGGAQQAEQSAAAAPQPAPQESQSKGGMPDPMTVWKTLHPIGASYLGGGGKGGR